MKRTGSLSRRAISALVLAASASGCAYIEQAQDGVPMTAVIEMRRAQTMNPSAVSNRKAVVGLDGLAGSNVSDAYAKSFVPKEVGQTSKGFIGLGGVGGQK